jgi:hypothetical protein
MKYTPEIVKCHPISKEKIDKYVNECILKQTGEGDHVAYDTGREMAIITKPKLCVIDQEYIGLDLGKVFEIRAFRSEKHNDGSISFGCTHAYVVPMPLDDIKNYLLPEVTLAEFTKPRRGYNSRIVSNEHNWVKYLNS